jgi:hypothetical protein
MVAKNRRCGNTGLGSWVRYNSDTLLLEETSDPYDDEFDDGEGWK